MDNQLVSIILPTLNAGKLLPDFLTSLVNQNYKNIEVIINDDHRTADNTEKVIAEFSNKLKITLIKKNKLLGGARLEGARLANGKFIMHLDADMQVKPDLIAHCVELALKNGAKAIYIPEEVIGEGFFTKAKWLEKTCYTGDEEISSPRFFDKDTYFLVGGHNPNLNLSEDSDINIKFKKHKKILVNECRFEEAQKLMQWSKISLYHNERRITLMKTFLNKFYWSQTGFEFLEAQPIAAWKQVVLIFFRPAYLRNLKLLLRYPHLTFGMYLLKTAEFAGALIGGIGTKIGLIKKINYQNTNNKS